MELLKIIIVILSVTIFNGQIALPTFQFIYGRQNTSFKTPENALQSSGKPVAGTNIGRNFL